MSQDHAATQAMSNFHQVFAEAMDRNRALLLDIAGLMRDESARFVNLRLDRTRQAMEQLSECKGLPGLLSVQQAWMGELIQDVTAQGLRYSELFAQSAGRAQDEVQEQAEGVAEAAEPAAQQAQDNVQDIVRQASNNIQDAMSHEPDYSQPHLH